MAQKKILNKVKNGSGYDTLFPQILSQVHYASSVSGTSTTYAVTIDMPAEEITAPIIVCFIPNVTNSANATININGLGAKALYLNNGAISASQITTSDKCLVYYDKTASSATLLSVSSFVKIPKATSAQVAALYDGNSYITPSVLSEGVLAASRYQPLTPISKNNVMFDDTYSVGTARLIHYDIMAFGRSITYYTTVKINGMNLTWDAKNSGTQSLRLSIDIDTFTQTVKITENSPNTEDPNNTTTKLYSYDTLTGIEIYNRGNYAYTSVGYKLFGYIIRA